MILPKPIPSFRLGIVPKNRSKSFLKVRNNAASRRYLFTATQKYNSQINENGSENHNERLENLNFAVAGAGIHANATMILDDDHEDGKTKSITPDKLRKLNAIDKDFNMNASNSSLVLNSAQLNGLDIDGEPKTLVDNVVDKMRAFMNHGMPQMVLNLFESSGQLQQIMPTEAYNLVLKSISIISSKSDVTTQLQVYEKMLGFGIKPNMETYCMVLNDLVSSSIYRAKKFEELKPLLGNESGVLESVDEAYESLAVTEPLLISVNILNALQTTSPIMSPELQICVNRIIRACEQLNIEVPSHILQLASSSLPSVVFFQSNISDAEKIFTTLGTKQQKSKHAQEALLKAFFKYNHVEQAMKFFSDCGAPKYLLEPLLRGFASKQLVGTCREWMDNYKNISPDTISAVLSSIPLTNAADTISSATVLFNKFVALNGSTPKPLNTESKSLNPTKITNYSGTIGRSAFIQLSIEANDFDKVLMAVKESWITLCLWDSITISKVVDYFYQHDQQLLASDIAVWQINMLHNELTSKGVKSFISQELANQTFKIVNSADIDQPLLANIYVRLLPIVKYNTVSLDLVLPVIGKVDEQALLSIEPQILYAGINEVLCLLSPLSQSDSLNTKLKLALSKLFNAALAANCKFSQDEFKSISGILENNDAQGDDVNITRSESINLTDSKSHNVSEMIKNYSKLPYGLDIALDKFDEAVRFKLPVSAEAMRSLLISATSKKHSKDKHASTELLDDIYNRTLHSDDVLSIFIEVCSSAHPTLAMKAYQLLKDKGSYPSTQAYTNLIRIPFNDKNEALRLFEEVKSLINGNAVTVDIYNSILSVLSKAGSDDIVESLLHEMESLFGVKFSDLDINTVEGIIGMHIYQENLILALKNIKELTQHHRGLLSLNTFNLLISKFIKAGDKDNALDTYAELLQIGTLPSPETYKLLMEVYLMKSRTSEPNLRQADEVLTSMKNSEIPITNKCFAVLLRARGVIFKDLTGAKMFYRGLVKNSRVTPDRNIFNALLESYIHNGKSDEIQNVLEEMTRYKVPIDKEMKKIIYKSTSCK
ncbi:hypothetical protein DASB73_002450 [Starmerella bacillaris]|uniref:Uncharacterized protein n=1 Tax=Starmerella bacillaris TaxID=1247836 RepID=A0AAV5RDU7_STABA|nr:hypothetical protein DASB73_002450 [Starmerella bacillaris]